MGGGSPQDQPGGSIDDAAVLVRRDQLEAIRRSVLHALPVNVLLGLASAAVSLHAGNGQTGLIWFAASSLVNAGRAVACRAPCRGLETGSLPGEAVRSIDLHLGVVRIGALLSGLVWAFLPVLCDGYTTPQTLFYLTVTCGITSGAVTYGTAYARVPIFFLTPPLLSVVICLFLVGGFDRVCLALTVILYLVALIKGTLQTESVFCAASRSKNEARAAAASLEVARAKASTLAAEMEHRATYDALTQLLNRAGFASAAEAWLRRGTARPCLMLLDLDGFKAVNDLYGHKMGDRVLVEVAKRLRLALPGDCLASRSGGDEFAVFFDAAAEPEPPVALAQRLIGVVGAPFKGFDVGRLGVSIGIDASDAGNLTRMLNCADEALHAAKMAGRSQIVLFDEALKSRAALQRDARRDLAEALVKGGVEVWLQPIFGQGGRRLSSFEALLRWHHPEHGWIVPGEIINFAGLESLAETLFGFILERICLALRVLADSSRTDLRIAVNVSPREMAQIAVDTMVLQQLRIHDLPTSMIEIEVTEETPLDVDAVRDRLFTLSAAGIRIAVDDFGAGYSSLASLHQLRAQRVKIDRSIIAGLAADPSRQKMVEAVVGLGQALDLDVVAEGVEAQSDLDVLRELGCDYIQGFLLGRPMPIPAALALAGIAETHGA